MNRKSAVYCDNSVEKWLRYKDPITGWLFMGFQIDVDEATKTERFLNTVNLHV